MKNIEVFPVLIPEILPKGWKQISNEFMEALGGKPEECPAFQSTNGLKVFLTSSRELDGRRWIHLSVSRKDSIPNYYDLCDVKKIFLGDERLAIQLFVPTSEHVNIHPNCLHLWSCLDGNLLPDFTRGTGTI